VKFRVLSKTDAAKAVERPIPNVRTRWFLSSDLTNSKRAGNRIKKQATPSPDNNILSTVSKSGSTILHAIMILPATTRSLSGMNFLKTRKMMGENMNSSTNTFWFNDNVMRRRMYVDSTKSEKIWMKNRNIILVKMSSE
jgi:hypothetical protein